MARALLLNASFEPLCVVPARREAAEMRAEAEHYASDLRAEAERHAAEIRDAARRERQRARDELAVLLARIAPSAEDEPAAGE